MATKYPYKCDCTACTAYPPSPLARSDPSPFSNKLETSTPPPSPTTTSNLYTYGTYASPPLPTLRELFHNNRRERMLEIVSECDFSTYENRDISSYERITEISDTEMSSEFAQSMMGNDHIEKPSEAGLADSRKAMDARHKAERKRCRHGVRALLEKVKELKLVPEDDSEEEKEEMERMLEN